MQPDKRTTHETLTLRTTPDMRNGMMGIVMQWLSDSGSDGDWLVHRVNATERKRAACDFSAGEATTVHAI